MKKYRKLVLVPPMKTTEKCLARVNPVDEKNISIHKKFIGKTNWEIISGKGKIKVSPDGYSAYLISADKPGQTVVRIQYDIELKEGRKKVEEFLRFKYFKVSQKKAKVRI